MLDIIRKTYNDLPENEKQAIYWGNKLIGVELSKFIILLIIFIIMGKWGEFLISITMLLPLRCNLGGLHFKTYYSCLFATFVIFFIAIFLLPNIILSRTLVSLLMGCCILLTWKLGPIMNPTRPPLQKSKIIKLKKRAVLILIFYTVLYCTFPNNTYIICSIWITVEQTLQLLLSKYKGGIQHDTIYFINSSCHRKLW